MPGKRWLDMDSLFLVNDVAASRWSILVGIFAALLKAILQSTSSPEIVWAEGYQAVIYLLGCGGVRG